MEAAWAWQVLGVPPGSPPERCRRAFRTGAQLLHPDRVADLPDDVRAEAHRRMVELAEAYRVCTDLAAGVAPRARRRPGSAGPLPAAGADATALLDDALATADARDAVQLLELVADAWPGTAEGDRARALLVTSEVARSTLSARERAGHLVLVLDDTARQTAWESHGGRDELTVARVVYDHRTAPPSLRRQARSRLAELEDWATLRDDADDDIRRAARTHLLLLEARTLAERAPWVTRRERAGFDAEVTAWHQRADGVRDDPPDADILARLEDAARSLRSATTPVRAGRA